MGIDKPLQEPQNETPFDMARASRPVRIRGSRRKMRRGLPSFGTVWHHPKTGGDNRTAERLLVRNDAGDEISVQ
jgi:hypothetical protein